MNNAIFNEKCARFYIPAYNQNNPNFLVFLDDYHYLYIHSLHGAENVVTKGGKQTKIHSFKGWDIAFQTMQSPIDTKLGKSLYE